MTRQLWEADPQLAVVNKARAEASVCGDPDSTSGVGERNLDRIVHAIVEADGPGTVTVRFEDLHGGGDLSYSDAVIRVIGASAR